MGDNNRRMKSESSKRPDYLVPLPGDDTTVMPWFYSRWLTFSSCFFLIPAFVALRGGCRKLAVLYVITAFVSANYWRRCSRGFRRNADLIMAKVSFFATLAVGIVNVRDFNIIAAIWAHTVLIGVLYGLSSYFHSCETLRWLPVHGVMHIFISTGMATVAYGSCGFLCANNECATNTI